MIAPAGQRRIDRAAEVLWRAADEFLPAKLELAASFGRFIVKARIAFGNRCGCHFDRALKGRNASARGEALGWKAAHTSEAP